MNHQKEPSYRVKGKIEKILSHDTKTGYLVLRITELPPGRRTISVITHLPACHIGINMLFQGDWRFNDGSPIFYADYVYELPPTTLTEIRAYLKSGICPKIDKKLANSIVKQFQQSTMEVLNSDISALLKVPGISKNLLSHIIVSWNKHQKQQDTIHFLQKHGLTARHAYNIHQIFYDHIIEKIKENPYRLIQEIEALDFQQVDAFALSMGIDQHDSRRVQAAIIYALELGMQRGHCFMYKNDIWSILKRYFTDNFFETYRTILSDMCARELLKTRREKVFTKNQIGETIKVPRYMYYLPHIYDDESYVATKLSSKNIPDNVDRDQVKDLIQNYHQDNLHLSAEQVQAVLGIVCSPYSILTGSPGTGKSATLKAVVHVLQHLGKRILLAAPTGRAAQHLTDIIGEPSYTIHRLLSGSENKWQYHEHNQLETDFIIVDESSMLDIRLTAALLRACPDTAQVLFVGDPDQLPSIGPGNVLKDLIASEAIPVYRLTQTFRQSEGSVLLGYAAHIKSWSSFKTIKLSIDTFNQQDHHNGICDCFHFFSDMYQDTDLWEQAINKFVKYAPYNLNKKHFMQLGTLKKDLSSKEFTIGLISSLYQALMRCDQASEIQILSPRSIHDLGTNHINRFIQELVNPYHQGNKPYIKTGNKIFRPDDRVIHCKNNYQLNVFNGEVGRVVDVGRDTSWICKVSYPGNRVVTYNHTTIKDLDLAYAITIHKSQGSEFDVVIIPMVEGYVFSRELIYTAMTRAKTLVVFVGDIKAYAKALDRPGPGSMQRKTALPELLISL